MPVCNHENREIAMSVIDEKTWCDPCLEPLIRALNTNGLRTIASCCGHGEQFGSICLRDGRVLVVSASLSDWYDLDARVNPTPAEIRVFAEQRATDTHWKPEGVREGGVAGGRR